MYLKSFLKKCTERCKLDLALFFISTRIKMASVLKKTEIKFELLTDIDMLQMLENGIRGGVSHAIHEYAK